MATMRYFIFRIAKGKGPRMSIPQVWKGHDDTIQVDMKMAKEAKDKAQDEQSSQRTIYNPTKDHMDLTKRS